MNIIKCNHCKEEKDSSFFQKSKVTKSGFINTCFKCNYKRRIERQSPEQKEKVQKRRLELYKLRKENDIDAHNKYLLSKKEYRDYNKEKSMLLGVKRRALINNIPFSLTKEDIIIPEYCPILDIKLVIKEGKDNLAGPSIDKIIPELGYVKGNIRVISRKANMMKLNASFEELKTFSKNILKYIKDYE